jgi:hypothetical protein
MAQLNLFQSKDPPEVTKATSNFHEIRKTVYTNKEIKPVPAHKTYEYIIIGDSIAKQSFRWLRDPRIFGRRFRFIHKSAWGPEVERVGVEINKYWVHPDGTVIVLALGSNNVANLIEEVTSQRPGATQFDDVALGLVYSRIKDELIPDVKKIFLNWTRRIKVRWIIVSVTPRDLDQWEMAYRYFNDALADLARGRTFVRLINGKEEPLVKYYYTWHRFFQNNKVNQPVLRDYFKEDKIHLNEAGEKEFAHILMWAIACWDARVDKQWYNRPRKQDKQEEPAPEEKPSTTPPTPEEYEEKIRKLEQELKELRANPPVAFPSTLTIGRGRGRGRGQPPPGFGLPAPAPATAEAAAPPAYQPEATGHWNTDNASVVVEEAGDNESTAVQLGCLCERCVN